MDPRLADHASTNEAPEKNRTRTGRLGLIGAWAAGLVTAGAVGLFVWRASGVDRPLPADAEPSPLYKQTLERASQDERDVPAAQGAQHRGHAARPKRRRAPAGRVGSALVDRGRELFNQGRYAEALRLFQQAVKQRPDDYLAHCCSGDAYIRLGMPRQALASYRKGFELNPRFSVALHGIAQAYLILGEPQEAMKAYEKALEIRPDDQAAARALRALRSQFGRSPTSQEAVP